MTTTTSILSQELIVVVGCALALGTAVVYLMIRMIFHYRW